MKSFLTSLANGNFEIFKQTLPGTMTEFAKNGIITWDQVGPVQRMFLETLEKDPVQALVNYVPYASATLRLEASKYQSEPSKGFVRN